MPTIPDLLSEEPQTRSPSRSPARTAKTKSKDKKAKKKNDAAAATAPIDEEPTKALEAPSDPLGTSPAFQAMPSDEPPSPTFEPSAVLGSPFISSLGQQPFARPPHEMNDWEQAVPFGNSPPDRPTPVPEPGAHSPPLPSSPKPRFEELRGGFGGPSPSTSPRLTYLRPARPGQQEVLIPRHNPPSSPRGRPPSMPPQYPALNALPHFATPAHQPPREPPMKTYQSRSSSRRGQIYDFQAFDTLPSGEDASTPGHEVLLTSTLNSLYVHEVSADSLRYYGHLDGLRGSIISAKILPVSQRYDRLRELRPLVAVVVHGPYIPADQGGNESFIPHYTNPKDPHPALQTNPPVSGVGIIDNKYQTTVEVYSLQHRRCVATLYRSPVVDVELVPGQMFIEAPSPVGSLSVDTKGRFVTVASAVSGEVYIYEAVRNDFTSPFRCIGKVWTSMPTRKHRTWSASSAQPPSEVESIPDTFQPSTRIDLPTYSLTGRWLVTIPPVPSSQSTLHGAIDNCLKEKSTPGLASHTSGSHPTATCEVDAPFEESRMNRAARDVTQEFLKGAQWVGSQGMQAWKSYWNKPEESSAILDPPRSPPINPQFPPTHARDESVRNRQHSTIVTIFDLEKLSESQDSKNDAALRPVAAFPLIDGCSFLSSSPNGLMLLTASTKGDVQYVWDLMRMSYPRNEAFNTSSPSNGPLVRQVARFTRMTQASIVDVIWSEPIGERLAVLTERGTVHVHDLSSNAFAWPPPRPKRPSTAKKRQSDVVPAASGWGAALSSVTGRAQPILAAARETRIPSLSGLNISAAGAGAGVKGGKLVATGFSKSVGAATGTVNSLYHMGENRLHIPSSSSRSIKPGIVRWMQQKDFVALVVVGDAKVQIHGVIRNSDLRGGRKRQSIIGHRLAEYNVPKKREPDPQLPNDGFALGGYWPMALQRPRSSRATTTPFSHAELETCTPFQPFHTDSRVTLRVFNDDNLHMDHEDTPWLFGQPIATQEVNVASEEDYPPVEAAGPMESFIRETVPARVDTPAQVTISTKRKKVKKGKGSGTVTARELIEGPEEVDSPYAGAVRAENPHPQEWFIDDDDQGHTDVDV